MSIEKNLLHTEAHDGRLKEWLNRRKANKGKSSFKSCNGFYKNGKCYSSRAAWREERRWKRKRKN